MKYLFTLIVLSALLAQVSAQSITNSYQWKAKPEKDNVNRDTSLQAVYLQKTNIKEMIYEQDNLFEYFTEHNKVKILTSRALEGFKTIYFPKSKDSEITREQARVIRNDGTIVELTKDNFKEGIDEESGSTYRYFAFEGIEIGSEIEYIYTIKKIPYHKGLYFTPQSRYPIVEYSFDLYVPENLIYKFKSYNGLPEAQVDTSYTEGNHWQIAMKNMPELLDEEVSNYETSRMAFGFKLDRNTATGMNDITSYGPWAKQAYEGVYRQDKERKGIVKKILKDMDLKNTKQDLLVREIEDYLKSNYSFYNASSNELENFTMIYKNKAFNDVGSVFIYAQLFKELAIPHELVVTTDRDDIKFDPNFESFVYIDDYMFYFPQIDKYLAPTRSYSRLGFPPYEFTHNYGLFIKEVKMGDFVSGIGKIKFIKPLAMDATMNLMQCKVTMGTDFSDPRLNFHQELSGYDAYYSQPVFELITDPADLKKFQDQITKYMNFDAEAESVVFTNDNGKDFGVKPFILDAQFNAEELVQKSGETYLFKLGALIGPQMEIYNDLRPRQLNVAFQYARKYHRELMVQIPLGYQIQNLNDIKMQHYYTDSTGVKLFGFESNYSIEGEWLKVIVDEWYEGIEYDKSVWNSYRDVINAAANFNKINLVLKK